MMYSFGRRFRLSLFGRSHADCVGCIIENVPVRMKLDIDSIRRKMELRRPSHLGTDRKEKDEVVFEHGVKNGIVTDSTVVISIKNEDFDGSSYEQFKRTPRPGHADLPALMKFKDFDISGGGQFSGRMTAPIVAAGAIAEQIISSEKIKVAAYSKKIYNISDSNRTFREAQSSSKYITRAADANVDRLMQKAIENAKNNDDSIGGIVECIVTGLPIGFGSEWFESLDVLLSQAMMSIPGVKGIEFGDGFTITDMKGSESNDQYALKNGSIVTSSNHMGGIVGGMSNGSDLVFRIAVKPTPSIGKEQNTVDIVTIKDSKLRIEGRHDPCIVPRIVPVVESMAAIVIVDEMLTSPLHQHF